MATADENSHMAVEGRMVWDRGRLLFRVGQDTSLLKILVETFIQQWPDMKMELERQLSGHDANRSARAAHAIKGAAANLEAKRILELSLNIEKLAGEGNFSAASALADRLDGEFENFLAATRGETRR